jgi:hypothetical protein
MKNVIRIANPAAVMSGVLDLFLAQPFGARSLLQRILSMTLTDGIKGFQKAIDSLYTKIADPILCEKIKCFTNADEDTKNEIRQEAEKDDVDIVVAILRSELFTPDLTPEQIGKIFNAYVAWNNAVDNVSTVSEKTYSLRLRLKVDEEMKSGAQLFSHLKQLLKLLTRQRDKAMMLDIIEEVNPYYVSLVTFLTKISAHLPRTLPRPLHNLLRTSHPRLQIRQRIQQHHRLRHFRRRRHHRR